MGGGDDDDVYIDDDAPSASVYRHHPSETCNSKFEIIIEEKST